MPGGLWEVVLSFKFRQNRLNGFRAVGGRNLPFPILKASGLYNSLYYRTSRDTHLYLYLLHYFITIFMFYQYDVTRMQINIFLLKKLHTLNQ